MSKKNPNTYDLSAPLDTNDWRRIALTFARVLWLALPTDADDFGQCMKGMQWAECTERAKRAEGGHLLIEDHRLDALVIANFIDEMDLEHIRERLAYEWHQSPEAPA